MQTIFFFQTQQIPDSSSSSIFNQFKEQKIFFSYFQVDRNYYLFVYSQKSIDINFVYQSVEIIEELDSKQRKIRSLRGFFLYALEIMEKGKDHEILQTNLQSFFWRKVRNIIRQNKKTALKEFLFGKEADNKDDNRGSNPTIQRLENQIQNLHNKVDSLQQKVIQLESKLENPKYALSEPSQPLESSKTIQQGHYTLEEKKASYLQKNDPKRSAVLSEIRNPVYQTKDIESNVLSEASKIDFKGLSDNKQYNLTSNEYKGLNRTNFITLGKISEKEKIEIIQLGFQLQNEGKISLKKYYESTDPYSLFQFRGYNIKYESIRRTKLYQQFKK